MTNYYNDVNDLLGEKFVGKLHQHAANMSHTDMEEFATLLGDKVRGRHKSRMERYNPIDKQPQMRNILSDWYNDELCELDREAGRKKLISTLRSNTLGDTKAIADDLQKEHDAENTLENDAEMEIEETLDSLR